MHGWVGYLITGLIGAIVGLAEIAFRYRDKPGQAVRQPASVGYALVNAAASAGALYVTRVFGWTFGASAGASRDLLRVMLSGFGALALFRTKLFSAASKEENVAWGPSRLLEQLLAISDTQVDRWQAQRRSKTVAKVMLWVSFEKAAGVLPVYALGLLEHVDAAQQRLLAVDLNSLVKSKTMDDAMKAQALGVALVRLTGSELLTQAVLALSPGILQDGAPQPALQPRRRGLRARLG